MEQFWFIGVTYNQNLKGKNKNVLLKNYSPLEYSREARRKYSEPFVVIYSQQITEEEYKNNISFFEHWEKD